MWFDHVAPDAIGPGTDAPLHAQLSALIRSAISDGELPPGAHLPTESDFQNRFGISRSVVRQALASLDHEGLVQRGRGRGTVVAPARGHHRAVQRMAGLLSQIAEPDQVVTTEVLQLGRESDPQAEIALATSQLVFLERLRSVNGIPIALIRTWLPEALVPGIDARELTDASLHELLLTRYGVPVSAGHRQIRAVAAAASLATSLSCEPGSPLLVLEGTSLDDRGRTVEFFRTWHRSDQVVFDVDARGGLEASLPREGGTGEGAVAQAGGAVGGSGAVRSSREPARSSREPARSDRVRELADALGALAEELAAEGR